MRSSLRLRRLSVFLRGKTVYSEKFHDGVNIIHGANGSGKSTIADFIFFALGGELKDWKERASHCEYVIAEVVTPNATLTLRRDVSEMSGRPMQVFFGAYDDAMAAGPAAWNLLPYKRPTSGLSFSQVLFRAIGIPEAVSVGDSNLTMHQILRLLYGDQMTPIQRIFRQESFDTWEMRQAVGFFLCGVGGYELHNLQLELRTLNARHDEVSRELRALMVVAGSYGDKILAEQLEAIVAKSVKDRDSLVQQLDALLSVDNVEGDTEIATKAMRSRSRNLQQARREGAELEDRVATLIYESEDSARFIEHLEQTLRDFNDAAGTFFSLGHLRFEFCPSCFSPVADNPSKLHCQLCGVEIGEAPDGEKKLAARLDLEMQLAESRALAEERRRSLEDLRAALRSAQLRLRSAAEAVDSDRHRAASKREAAVAELSRGIGFLDSELALLQRRIELSEKITRLSVSKEQLNAEISKLKTRVDAIGVAQDKRKRIALTAVAGRTADVLRQDLEEQSDFLPLKDVSFSFPEDWIAINGDKNRSRSASGMVILKNGFQLGLLLTALDDRDFLHPRFMLLDNIEDKGMIRERSWNFQNVLVQELKKYTEPFQVIFTTSMLAPSLEGSSMLVGRKLTRAHPSLAF